MSTAPKPLFRPEALKPKLRSFHLPPRVLAARQKLATWAAKFDTDKLDRLKETELLPGFLAQIFGDLLGYTGPVTDGPTYSMKLEANIQVDSNRADATFGTFGGAKEALSLVLEGKGPLDPLDKPFKSRSESAVRQCLSYARNLGLDWYVVTNMRETRIYSKQADERTFESFRIDQLAHKDDELKRFVYLLGVERIIGESGANHLDSLYAESKKIGRELTDKFYSDYKQLRNDLFGALRTHNADRKPGELLAATQKILDRVLFVAFCEDRALLPSNIIERAYEQKNAFRRAPIWDNFVGLFKAVHGGDPPLEIEKYNGGLFKEDEYLDSLNVPDAICERFKNLAEWEFDPASEREGKLIDVEILGHIFEQSIADLEEMHRQIDANPEALPEKVGPSKRKKEGAFYTPNFVTRYIVEETLGPVFSDRFERLRTEHHDGATKGSKKLFVAPRDFDTKDLTPGEQSKLVAFWDAWIAALQTIRVVDPSCGSGAFLIEAFERLMIEYAAAQSYRTALAGPSLFDFNKTILTNNLFGIDLNGEAVEIARLSCWIKTAEAGKELTTLDGNILKGNSIVGGSDTPLAAWAKRFPAAMGDGGFDAVIGNPPYVRQEWITADKPYLKRHYDAFDGVADLYVYFYELGLKVLKPGGRLGFIVTNKWMKAGYGETLRKLYSEKMWVEQVVDFGHAKQIFPDADVFPCILVAQKPKAAEPPADVRICIIPREQLRIDDLSNQIQEEGIAVPRSRLSSEPWSLEEPGVAKLMEKIRTIGMPLQGFAACKPYRGILTGFNKAFVIDVETRNKLIREDAHSESVIKKYLRGQDIDRWHPEWAGEWMIFARRGIDIDQFPAIKKHLEGFREGLEPKPQNSVMKDWPGRKAGAYKWFELQDSIDYWQQFEKPKIGYQVIQYHSSYCFDTSGMYGNDKTFFIPSGDLYLLGVLNSPLMWWHNWRTLVHLKDEALSPMGYLVEQLPIASPTPNRRTIVEAAVAELIEITKQQRKLARGGAGVAPLHVRHREALEAARGSGRALRSGFLGAGEEEPAGEAIPHGRRSEGAARDLRRQRDRPACARRPRGCARVHHFGLRQRRLRIDPRRSAIDVGHGPAADAARGTALSLHPRPESFFRNLLGGRKNPVYHAGTFRQERVCGGRRIAGS